jgi:hypothetical protein
MRRNGQIGRCLTRGGRGGRLRRGRGKGEGEGRTTKDGGYLSESAVTAPTSTLAWTMDLDPLLVRLRDMPATGVKKGVNKVRMGTRA